MTQRLRLQLRTHASGSGAFLNPLFTPDFLHEDCSAETSDRDFSDWMDGLIGESLVILIEATDPGANANTATSYALGMMGGRGMCAFGDSGTAIILSRDHGAQALGNRDIAEILAMANRFLGYEGACIRDFDVISDLDLAAHYSSAAGGPLQPNLGRVLLRALAYECFGVPIAMLTNWEFSNCPVPGAHLNCRQDYFNCLRSELHHFQIHDKDLSRRLS